MELFGYAEVVRGGEEGGEGAGGLFDVSGEHALVEEERFVGEAEVVEGGDQGIPGDGLVHQHFSKDRKWFRGLMGQKFNIKYNF